MVRMSESGTDEPAAELDAELDAQTDPRRAAARQAAVLLLLYPGPDGEPFVPFVQRTQHLSSHSGQIGLPGGGVDPGETIEAAARREAWEELGIDPGSYEVVGTLPATYTQVSHHVVTPVIAVSHARPEFLPDTYEVEHVIEVPLAVLEDAGNWRAEEWDSGWGRRTVHFVDYQGWTIWGLTGRILQQYLRSGVSGDARRAFERRVRHR